MSTAALHTAVAETIGKHGPDVVVEVLVEELRTRVDHHADFGAVTVRLDIVWGGETFAHLLQFEAGREAGRAAPSAPADVVIRWALDDLVRQLFPAADRHDRLGWDYEPVWSDRMRAELAAVRAGARDLADVQREFDETVYEHHHWYTQHYDTHLRSLRDQPVRVPEIGIGGYQDPRSGGESLRMWEQYFRRGLVYGLDIHEKKGIESTRIRTLAGDQSDPRFLDEIGRKHGPFDVIIDDGSHANEHVITSFESLFPHLRDEGYYVVEDTQTAYWPSFGGTPEGVVSAGTSLGFLARLIDGLNHREHQSSPDQEPGRYDRSIGGIFFYHNLVFVKKAVNGENGWPIWARNQNPGG